MGLTERQVKGQKSKVKSQCASCLERDGTLRVYAAVRIAESRTPGSRATPAWLGHPANVAHWWWQPRAQYRDEAAGRASSAPDPASRRRLPPASPAVRGP